MQSAVEAGLRVPATTVNMMCGSGLKYVYTAQILRIVFLLIFIHFRSVQLGYAAILSGQANVVVCGGQENMSRAQHVAYVRNITLASTEFKDSILCDGLTCASTNLHMGETGDFCNTFIIKSICSPKNQSSLRIRFGYANDLHNLLASLGTFLS